MAFSESAFSSATPADFGLKNLKVIHSLSDDGPCFSARVYFQGLPLCDVSNSGHGGPNTIDAIKASKLTPPETHKAVALIESALATQEIPNHDVAAWMNGMTYSLDIVIGALISKTLAEKDAVKTLNRIAVLAPTEDGSYEVLIFPAKYKPTAAAFAEVKQCAWFTPKHTILNELDRDHAIQLIVRFG